MLPMVMMRIIIIDNIISSLVTDSIGLLLITVTDCPTDLSLAECMRVVLRFDPAYSC